MWGHLESYARGSGGHFASGGPMRTPSAPSAHGGRFRSACGPICGLRRRGQEGDSVTGSITYLRRRGIMSSKAASAAKRRLTVSRSSPSRRRTVPCRCSMWLFCSRVKSRSFFNSSLSSCLFWRHLSISALRHRRGGFPLPSSLLGAEARIAMGPPASAWTTWSMMRRRPAGALAYRGGGRWGLWSMILGSLVCCGQQGGEASGSNLPCERGRGGELREGPWRTDTYVHTHTHTRTHTHVRTERTH